MNRAATFAAAASFCLFASSVLAAPAMVVTSDPKAQPESITALADGTLYTSSLAAPVIYRALPGAKTAEPFIDMHADHAAFVLGVLADPGTKTLWACEILSMDRSTPFLKGKTDLRAFDLASGADKGRWPLPEASNVCNDFTVASDHALYISDTSNGQILRLRPGGKALEKVIQSAALYGIDGITAMDGALYVNTVTSNNLYRVPLDASGKAGEPVELYPSRLLKSPDGIRAAHGKLFLAENMGGKVDEVTVHGDQAVVTTLKDGLVAPTAVEPAGGTLWIGDRGASKIYTMALPN